MEDRGSGGRMWNRRNGPELRPAVGALVLDHRGCLLLGRRNDSPRAHWQLPQGGIGPGENPDEAVVRELLEEIGTSRVRIVGVLPRRTRYVWSGPGDATPSDVAPDGTPYDGQAHTWFVVRLDGELEEEQTSEEFSAFAWIEPDELLETTHPVRRATYQEVYGMFRRWLARHGDR